MADTATFKDVPDDISPSYLPYTPTLRQKQRAISFVKASYIKSLTFSKLITNHTETISVSARVYRSQKKSEEPHKVNLDIKTKERIVADAYCSCKAGYRKYFFYIYCK